MREDLTARINNFAVYLPAVQRASAEKLADEKVLLRQQKGLKDLTGGDLNWLIATNPHWTYKWCLASSGHFAEAKRDNTITTRYPGTVVIGDSGGYQVGTGKLGATEEWRSFAKDTQLIKEKWRSSDVKRTILEWLDVNCDYAMTLDMPLWVTDKNKGTESPFHNFSTDELIEVSLENLRFFEKHRDFQTGCKFLNVLQAFGGDDPSTKVANSIASEDKWYDAVKHFPFEGWSLGGEVGWRGGIYRVLRRLLILRDDGLLSKPRNWCHLLGVSQITWSVYLTAIQRAIKDHINDQFTVSFDSASPYMTAGHNQQYAIHPNLSADLSDWVIRYETLPTGYGIANRGDAVPFPQFSPIASQFSLQDFNPNKDPFAPKTTDALADQVLINHNVYVFVKTFIEANELVFDRPQDAPPEIVQATSIIKKLFEVENWQTELEKSKDFLQSILKREPVNHEFDNIR